MKFTINGFSQKKLIEFGLDALDALILRYFVDFKDGGDMVIETVGNKPYYWVKYDTLMENIPIIKITSKDVLRRRLKKMEDAKVLIHYQKKKGGNYSFYGLGQNYKYLIKAIEETEGTTQKSEGNDSKVGRVPTQKSEQNINLLKDSSIKSIYCSVIDYLNQSIGSKYKATSRETQRLMHARLEEGFTVEDFKTVIDKKTKEWLNTDMAKYLRPSTLFGTKFEQYLNQAVATNKNKNEENTGSKEFDFSYLEEGENDE